MKVNVELTDTFGGELTMRGRSRDGISALIGYTTNAATYAGSYRMIRDDATGCRYLQVRRAGAWVTIDREIPYYIRGAYAAANWLGVL